MKALTFGANGQDGFYLNNLLNRHNIENVSVSRSGNFIKGSVADSGLVNALVREHRPDYIFHLAANSTTRYDALFENHETISTGTLNILDAVRNHAPASKVFLSGSALQFVNTGTPINEGAPFHASSPYSISRIQSVYAGRYFRSLGLQVYVGYLFNHESPQRTSRHVSKMISEAVKKVALNEQHVVTVGNIATRKEWTFAGDIVEAIWLLVNQQQVYEAVIGSGQPYSIKDWLDACFRVIGRNWQDYVQEQKNFTAEYDVLFSDPSVIKGLGWAPQVNLETLAKLMVEENT